MAESDLTPLLIVGGVAVYLMTRPPKSGRSAAAGTPPKPNGGISTEAAVGGAICAAAAGYAGLGPGGAALAGAACSKIAPAIVDGLEYAADKAKDGLVAVGQFAGKLPSVKILKTVGVGAYRFGANLLDDPVGTVVNTFVPEELQFGSSKVGRGANGKDVFPNDMVQCKSLGITTVDGCARLWDPVRQQWPWEAADGSTGQKRIATQAAIPSFMR